MSDAAKEACYEMLFCGNYLVQYGAVANWVDDKYTEKHALKQLLDFAERVKNAAAVIRTEMKNME